MRSAAQDWRHAEADLIEAGLNEGAGRTATLWALFGEGAARILARGCARRACAERRAIDGERGLWRSLEGRQSRRRALHSGGRVGAFCWPPAFEASRSWPWRMIVRARHDRAHDVSQRNGDVLGRGHSPPRGTSATHLMRPPHSGQAEESILLSRLARAAFFRRPCVRTLDLVRQQRATEGQPFGAMAVGEITEVTNAMEAVGQGVEQEAPDELVGRQAHDLCGAVWR